MPNEMYGENGGVMQSTLTMTPGPRDPREFGGETKIRLGQVLLVNYIDDLPSSVDTTDKTQLTKFSVTYDVIGFEDNIRAQVYRGCMATTSLSGLNNFSETILGSNEESDSDFEKNFNRANYFDNYRFIDHAGDMVVLLFMEGRIDDPIIIGLLNHPSNLKFQGTKREIGKRLRWEFAGINIEIQDNGALVFQALGSREERDFEGGQTASFPPTIQINPKSGAISLITGGTNLVLIGRSGVASLTGVEKVELGSKDVDEALILGTQYRKAQAKLHKKLTQKFMSFSENLTDAAVAAGALLVPPAAGASLGAWLGRAAKDALQIAQAYKEFEGGSKSSESKYLSKKVFTE